MNYHEIHVQYAIVHITNHGQLILRIYKSVNMDIHHLEVVRKADKAIGRHAKKQNKLCEYSY